QPLARAESVDLLNQRGPVNDSLSRNSSSPAPRIQPVPLIMFPLTETWIPTNLRFSTKILRHSASSRIVAPRTFAERSNVLRYAVIPPRKDAPLWPSAR